MTWTYGGDPSASTLAEVRFLIGDTDTDDQQLQDEEINHLLSENNGEPYAAAVDAAEALVALYARDVSRAVGDLQVLAEARAAHYAGLAERLRKQRRKHSPAAGIVLGNDQSQRLFEIGQMDGHAFSEDRSADDVPGSA